jgi:hypothetical protein
VRLQDSHNNGVVIMGRGFEGVTAINNGCNGAAFFRIEFDSKQTQPHRTRNHRLSSAARPTAVALTIGLRSGTTNALVTN